MPDALKLLSSKRCFSQRGEKEPTNVYQEKENIYWQKLAHQAFPNLLQQTWKVGVEEFLDAEIHLEPGQQAITGHYLHLFRINRS